MFNVLSKINIVLYYLHTGTSLFFATFSEIDTLILQSIDNPFSPSLIGNTNIYCMNTDTGTSILFVWS